MTALRYAPGSIEFAAFCARNDTEFREVVSEMLADKAAAALAAGDRRQARALNRCRNRPRFFHAVLVKIQSDAVPAYFAGSAVVEADGEFFKWLLEWFSDPANWEGLLQFILALISLFGGI